MGLEPDWKRCLERAGWDETYPFGSWIYVARVGDLYKIGHSCDPRRRMKEIANNCGHFPSLVMSREVRNSTAVEKALHDYFGRKRTYGEWFVLDHQDLVFIHAALSDVALFPGR